MEEVCQLQCRVCQKVFPKFDQRGFRNAGFTAHQNRCIEKDYLLNNPIPKKQTSPKQRLILPAPSNSVPISTYTIPSTLCPINITIAQKNMSMFQYRQHLHQFPQSHQTGTEHNEDGSYTTKTNRTENLGVSLFPSGNYSYSRTPNNEMFYPVTHCGYCNPEFGLHQSSCSFLSQILHQQRPPM
ncbi:uncharacterized protein EV154DRAFT_417661 [Mucor mucedo]|uniref:uncharacterized protein n=1 Tax=Mucor mucedo TaxID=29922 RepID=UPI00221ED7C2|nr:uncharacterized protein EV154DRAFT_417661 [Mucor mucedo]KAI7893031.1 hypothetical protein EV154DRAFT_417661 [Mucor mucedo]